MRDYRLLQALATVNFLGVIAFDYPNPHDEGSGYDEYTASYYENNGWETDNYDPWYGIYCYQQVCRYDKPKCCHQNGHGRCCSRDEHDYLKRHGKTRCLGSLNIIYTGVSCPTKDRPEQFICCPGGDQCCTPSEFHHLDKKDRDTKSKRGRSSPGIPFQGPMVGIVTIIVVMVGAAVAVLSRFIKTRKNRRLNMANNDAVVAPTQDPPPPYPHPYRQTDVPGVYNESYTPCVDVIIEDTPPGYNEVINPPPAYVTDYESSAESNSGKPT